MRQSPAIRRPYLLLAYLCVGMGGLGVALPGLPTTPFLLAAAWAARRGSPRLERWLDEHPRFGPLLRSWERERAIPGSAKWTAVAMLAFSWVILLRVSTHPLLPLASGVLFAVLAVFLLTRPSPARQHDWQSNHE